MLFNYFQVTDWPEDSYGEFYDGDSYIILNTYKEEDSDVSILQLLSMAEMLLHNDDF